jgi:quercetin dioxygenase-like cupin family protein
MTDQPAPPEHTSGTEMREPREVAADLTIHSLQAELDRLADEAAAGGADRDSVTLAKEPDLRVVLSLVAEGARMGEDQAHGSISIQVLTGSVAVERDASRLELGAGDLATLARGAAWSVEGIEESAVLMTFAWPEDRSLV